jgi:hypothetical protein
MFFGSACRSLVRRSSLFGGIVAAYAQAVAESEAVRMATAALAAARERTQRALAAVVARREGELWHDLARGQGGGSVCESEGTITPGSLSPAIPDPFPRPGGGASTQIGAARSPHLELSACGRLGSPIRVSLTGELMTPSGERLGPAGSSRPGSRLGSPNSMEGAHKLAAKAVPCAQVGGWRGSEHNVAAAGAVIGSSERHLKFSRSICSSRDRRAHAASCESPTQPRSRSPSQEACTDATKCSSNCSAYALREEGHSAGTSHCKARQSVKVRHLCDSSQSESCDFGP